MAIEIDMEGKDPLVYGDVFSSKQTVGAEPEAIDSSILLNPPADIALGPYLPAQPPIETVEK